MYDAAYMRDFYDAYGEQEWNRFEMDSAARVNFLVHRRYLEQYVHPGDRVLEVGAGPGRFTIELARLGASVLVGDLSPVQLELNHQRVAEAGYERAVAGREVMDIVDLSGIEDAQFDVVVCYGGALSYVFDQAAGAVRELLRVTKPGGYLLVSVMSLFGTLRRYLPAIGMLAEQYGIRVALEDVMESGNLSSELNSGHPMHLFRSAELLSLLEEHGGEVVDASAANFLAPGNEGFMDEMRAREDMWDALLHAEIEACKQPGAIDGGTHMIAVARRPQ